MHSDTRVQKVGDVSYLVEPGTGKPIYSFTFEGETPAVSIIAALSSETMEDVRRRALTITTDKTLRKSADLLMESLETRPSDLHSFIWAWTGLETFVKATFKATYNTQWFESLANGAPPAAKSYFDRLKKEMSSKNSITDRFIVIAAILEVNQLEAKHDMEEFERLIPVEPVIIVI